jgi:8-amino-7-oxononanoate synthase
LFHGAETALMAVNGGMANGAIFTAIPRPGDALVYDEFIHASVHDGMMNSLALCKKSFRHNSVDSFRDTLVAVRDSQPPIRNGARCVIVAVEGVYSMEGDVCPLQELVDAAKEVFPDGNAQFVIDEAHSHAVLGPKGAGLVSALGLEKEIAIRMHTLPRPWQLVAVSLQVSSLHPAMNEWYRDRRPLVTVSPRLTLSLAVIMSNNTVRAMLLNYGRNILFSGAPGFPLLAAIRVGYMFLKTGKTQQVWSG